ncbi:unnamed protein product [Ectocarpus sp. CCAP 1310/34]|nr:unnamed protein product [Ectocarpus sp. CCAP 1310/34]
MWVLALCHHRIAYFTLGVVVADTLLTLGASLVLFGKLRKTKDVFDMSLEIQKVGIFAMAALECYHAVKDLSTVGPSQARSNIQPVRAALLRGPAKETVGFISLLFPYIPWTKHGSRKVAVEASYTLRSQAASSAGGTVLDLIIQFPPLFQACLSPVSDCAFVESLMFLVDADEFNCSLHAVSKFTSAGADPSPAAMGVVECEENLNFEQFAAIVDKYIREGSPFEVNIESKIRDEILREVDRASFRRLTLDEKVHLLDKATKQVSNMLRENLYLKFRETEQFKQIQEQLFSVEQAARRSVV